MNPLKGWKGYLGGVGKVAVGAFVLYLSTQPQFTADIRAALAPAGLYAIFSGLGTLGIRDKQQRIGEKVEQSAVVAENAVAVAEQARAEVGKAVNP